MPWPTDANALSTPACSLDYWPFCPTTSLHTYVCITQQIDICVLTSTEVWSNLCLKIGKITIGIPKKIPMKFLEVWNG